MNYVLIILVLICYNPNKAIEECHPQQATIAYFQDSDLCEGAKGDLLKLQSKELLIRCEPVTRPKAEENSHGKK